MSPNALASGGKGRAALGAIALAWLVLVSTGMIVPVLDEIIYFADLASFGMGELLLRFWTGSPWSSGLALFRPIPLSVILAATLAWPDPETTWLALRWLAACVVLMAAWLISGWSTAPDQDAPRRPWRLALLLFAAGPAIAATWFANSFDAFAALGFALSGTALVRRKPVALALLPFAMALLCKEIAVATLPALAFLAYRFLPRKAGLAFVAGASALAASFVLIRHQLIPVGGAMDVHQPTLASLPFKLPPLLEQMAFGVPGVPWLVYVGAALAMAPLLARLSMAALAAALATCALAAFMMQPLSSQPMGMLDARVFQGRLVFVITWCILGMAFLGARTRTAAYALALVPGLCAFALTLLHYRDFQLAFADIYAATARQSVTAHWGTRAQLELKPSRHVSALKNDLTFRYDPLAAWAVDARMGKLHPKPPAFGLKAVAGRNAIGPPAPENVAGYIDAVGIDGRQLEISGWLGYPDGRAVDVVTLAGDDAGVVRLERLIRLDVAQAKGSDALIFSGFRMTLIYPDETTARMSLARLCLLGSGDNRPPSGLGGRPLPGCSR